MSRFTGALSDWKREQSPKVSHACFVNAAQTRVAGANAVFDFPAIQRAHAKIYVGVVAHRTATAARTVIRQAFAPSAIACFRESRVAFWRGEGAHVSNVAVRRDDGLIGRAVSRTLDLRAVEVALTVTAPAGTERAYSIETLLLDPADRRILYVFIVTEIGKSPYQLTRSLVRTGTR